MSDLWRCHLAVTTTELLSSSAEQSVTSKAKAGWSVTMEIARINGKWGILGIGNVYP